MYCCLTQSRVGLSLSHTHTNTIRQQLQTDDTMTALGQAFVHHEPARRTFWVSYDYRDNGDKGYLLYVMDVLFIKMTSTHKPHAWDRFSSPDYKINGGSIPPWWEACPDKTTLLTDSSMYVCFCYLKMTCIKFPNKPALTISVLEWNIWRFS